jgi:muconolactone D-isomerase
VHYLVELETRLPPDMPAAEREALLAREAQRGARLRDDGVIVGIWRLSGRRANIGSWDAPDAGALHDALTSLPAWPWMTVTVTALAAHPLMPDTPFPAAPA